MVLKSKICFMMMIGAVHCMGSVLFGAVRQQTVKQSISDVVPQMDQDIGYSIDPDAVAQDPSEVKAESKAVMEQRKGSEDISSQAVTAIEKPASQVIPTVDAHSPPVQQQPALPVDRPVAALAVNAKEKHSQGVATVSLASHEVPTQVEKFVGTGLEVRYIKAEQLYIRVKPNRYSKSLGVVRGGDEVRVTIQGDWAKLDDGQYIRSRWLVKHKPTTFGVEDTADH